MEELDRWALTRLDALVQVCRKAYDNYEFHVVSHAINDFCVVELSSFYLDIIKDRLILRGKDGLRRRSAQSALFLILDAMAKLFAPILAFTCDEIWQSMPHRASDDARNVLLNQMPDGFAQYALEDAAMEKWDVVMKLTSGRQRRSGKGACRQAYRQSAGSPRHSGDRGRRHPFRLRGRESGRGMHRLRLRLGAARGRR